MLVGRNQRCPCGSGKKYKYCCIKRKPREQYIYAGCQEQFEGFRFENGKPVPIDASGQRVEPAYTFLQSEYIRESGSPKVVNRLPDAATYDPNSYLASSYDMVWAIDTNTTLISNTLVSVSCIVESSISKESESTGLLQYRINGNILLKGCPVEEAEKYALSILVNMIRHNPTFRENTRVALITDHDLANHYSYNKKLIPIYKNIYIPEHFTLLYASSDTGDKDLVNMLIKLCDNNSHKVLNELSSKGYATIKGKMWMIADIPHYIQGQSLKALTS